MKELIFETISDCAAFKLFPRVAYKPFSAAAKLAVVSCCAVDDSSALSCGAATGDCGLATSIGAGWGVTARERGGRTLGVGGKFTAGAGRRNSGAFSTEKFFSVAGVSGMRGCTTEAVGHGKVARLCSAHPPAASAMNSAPATAAKLRDCERATGGVRRLDRTGWSVMR